MTGFSKDELETMLLKKKIIESKANTEYTLHNATLALSRAQNVYLQTEELKNLSNQTFWDKMQDPQVVLTLISLTFTAAQVISKIWESHQVSKIQQDQARQMLEQEKQKADAEHKAHELQLKALALQIAQQQTAALQEESKAKLESVYGELLTKKAFGRLSENETNAMKEIKEKLQEMPFRFTPQEHAAQAA